MKSQLLFRAIILSVICAVGWFSITITPNDKAIQNDQDELKKAPHHAHYDCGCDHCAHVLDSPRLKALTPKQRHSDYTINVIEPATAQIEYTNEVVPMIRQRAVSVNSLMNFRKELAIGDKIRMEFFPDAIVEGTIVKTHQNITGTFGYVAEDESGKNLLFVTENEGRLLATVVGEYAAYRLLYSATTKSHHAIEMDLEAAAKGSCGCSDDEVEALFNDPTDDEVNVSDANQLSGFNKGNPIEHFVDYMCVYTTDAKTYAEANVSGIYNVITQALLKANDAYEASDTKTQLRLVYTKQVDYNDKKNNVNTALSELKSIDDGIIDEVHADRETYKADLVSFLIYNHRIPTGSYVSGVASTPKFKKSPQSEKYKSQGFSAFEMVSATSYTFSHEIGHNLGCQHARDVFDNKAPGTGKLQDENPNNTFSPAAYGFSFVDNGVNRTTIMGYTSVNRNKRIPYLSNPYLKYNSITIGSLEAPEANNAGIIRDITAKYVEGYNESKVKDMTVTSPTTGAVWSAEDVKTVQWTAGPGTVKIELYKANTLVHTFTSSTPNDGSESITLPAGLGASDKYQVLVSRLDVTDTLPGISVDFTVVGAEVFPLASGKLPPGWKQVVDTDKPWVVSTSDVNEGRYSIYTNPINSFEEVGIEVTKNLAVGDVTFDYKVSLRSGVDQKLKFFVNGAEVIGWEGNVGWETYTYHIATAGTYTLKWVANRKGSSNSTSSKEAWVDNVVLPDGVNQSPVATGETYHTNPEAMLKVNASTGVLKNDSDDGTVTAVLGTTTANGTLNLDSDGSFTYTPNNGYVGIDSFTYTAFDGTLSSSTVTVEILVSTLIKTFPYTEGFGSGLGGWVQSRNDDFDWTRNKGATSLRSSGKATGPNEGKMGPEDYYMYTNSFNDTNRDPKGKSALFVSTWDFSTLNTPQLTFDYHMYGNAKMGTISVEAYTNAGTWSEVWKQEVSQGDVWKSSGVIDLKAYAGKSSVILRFKGLASAKFSDMAIDNISVMGEELNHPTFVLERSIVGDKLTWTVNREDGVASYRIEKLVNGTWGRLDSVAANKTQGGTYSINIEDDNAAYRIVSVATSGLIEVFPVGTERVNMSLKKGWNLLSTPFSHSDISALDGKLWAWDGSTYKIVTAPKVKSGFWLYLEAPTTVTVSGAKVENATIALKTGWNLIGPTMNMQAPSTDKLFAWELEYIDLSTEDNKLVTGHGYWIYRESPTELVPVK